MAAQPLSFIVRELTDDDPRTPSNLAYISSVNIGLFRCNDLHSSNYFGKKIPSHVAQVNGKLILHLKSDNNLQTGEIALNSAHREFLNVVTGGEVLLNTFSPPEPVELRMIGLEIKMATQDMDTSTIVSNFKKVLKNQMINLNQDLIVKYHTKTIRVTVACLDVDGRRSAKRGRLSKATKVFLQSAADSKFKLLGQPEIPTFQRKIDFKNLENQLQRLGVGGLVAPVTELLKAAFPSRNLSKDILQKLNYKHVRGAILYGPPGTGKTLVARTIAKIVNAKIKVVKGPEIFSKYLGESEKNMRALFEDAINDQRKWGLDSPLHFIVFDEIDSIGTKREVTSSVRAYADVMNQFLTLIDGFEELNNIFLLGTTNRIDALDPALTRSGRFELKLKIDLPDLASRLQILKIYTKHLLVLNMLDSDVNLEKIASQTKDYSGADIESLVSSSINHALYRASVDGDEEAMDGSKTKISMSDFDHCLKEVHQRRKSVASSQVSTLRIGLLILVAAIICGYLVYHTHYAQDWTRHWFGFVRLD